MPLKIELLDAYSDLRVAKFTLIIFVKIKCLREFHDKEQSLLIYTRLFVLNGILS